MQLNKEPSYLFYSNLGLNATSIKNILDVAKKIIDKNIKLAINPSWPLTILCSLDFQNLNILPIGDLDEITHWDNTIFMNYTYDDLKNYIHKIKYILINYIDLNNIELCSLPGFVHEWKMFTVLRFMSHSDRLFQNPQQREQRNKNTQNKNFMFEYFLPLNVFLDKDSVFRFRSMNNFMHANKSEDDSQHPCLCNTPYCTEKNANPKQQSTQTNVVFKYPFERLPDLDIIEMKKSIQDLFVNANCLNIINLNTTYEISACLDKILKEELYVQMYFVNSDYFIGECREQMITNTQTTNNNSFQCEFFYFKDSEDCQFDNRNKSYIDFEFFSYYITLIGLLRGDKKHSFVSAPFEYTFNERTTHNNFLGVGDFDLDFSRLHSNLNLIL